MKRSRIELMLEILDDIRMGSHRISDLIYDVRANYVTIRKYLELLEMKGLIESKPGRNKRNVMFFLTEKGMEVLKKLNEREILGLLERSFEELKEE